MSDTVVGDLSNLVKLVVDDHRDTIDSRWGVFDNIVGEYGVDNLRFVVPMRPLHSLHRFGLPLAMTDSSDEYVNVLCVISEERYKVADNYKITMKAVDPNFGSQHFYIMDFESMMVESHGRPASISVYAVKTDESERAELCEDAFREAQDEERVENEISSALANRRTYMRAVVIGNQLCADENNNIFIWRGTRTKFVVTRRYHRVDGWSLPESFNELHTDDFMVALNFAETLCAEYKRVFVNDFGGSDW